MNQLRDWLNGNQVFATVVLVLIIAVAVSAMVSGFGSNAPPVPVADYQCAAGHTWSQRVGAQPRCPTCSAPGITESRYLCPACNAVFTGMLVQKLDAGRFLYRTPGDSSDWRPAPPQSIRCENCGRTGDPSLAFRGIGYGDGTTEAAPDTVRY